MSFLISTDATAERMVPTSKLLASGEAGIFPGLYPTAAQLRQGYTMLPGDMPDAMAFYSFPMKHAGTMVHIGTALSHAHQAYNKGYLIYSGTPADGGLHDIPGLAANESTSDLTLFLLPSANLTIESATTYVQRRVERSAAACRAAGTVCPYVPQLRCYGGSGTEFVAADDDAGIVAGYYDRMVTPTCDRSEWSYGQVSCTPPTPPHGTPPQMGHVVGSIGHRPLTHHPPHGAPPG
jgi:hypothetical protein